MQTKPFIWAIVITLVLMLCSAGVRAESFTTNGPYGGQINGGIVMNPKKPNILYAGGTGGLFITTDGGEIWQPPHTKELAKGVSAIAVAPGLPETAYVSVHLDGIFKTTDSGKTWQRTAERFTEGWIFSLVIDPRNAGVIYAGTSKGIFKSSDGGSKWEELKTDPQKLSAGSMIMDPGKPDTLYVATYGDGIFKSGDAGKSWTAINNGLTTKDFVVIAADRTGQALYAATSTEGVFKSTDGGLNWKPAGDIKALAEGLGLWALDIDPMQPDTLYAGFSSGSGANAGKATVYKSIDGGNTWFPSGTGIRKSRIKGFAISAKNPGVMYAATFRGVFKSMDGGKNWIPANKGIASAYVMDIKVDPDKNNNLYVATGFGGLFKSEDRGATFREIMAEAEGTNTDTVVLNPADSKTVYSGAFGFGFLISGDSGKSWKTSSEGIINDHVYYLAVDPQNHRNIFATSCTCGGGTGAVFRSSDGGRTWVRADSGIATDRMVMGISVDPLKPSTLYAVQIDHGVWKSTDSGTTWKSANNGITDLRAMPVVIDPKDSNILYEPTYGGGVFKSTDGGGSWKEINNGLAEKRVRRLAIDPKDSRILYAGSYTGVYVSKDAGESWSLLEVTKEVAGINALALDPGNSNVLYVGTGGGMWRYEK